MALQANGVIRWGIVLLLMGGSVLAGAAGQGNSSRGGMAPAPPDGAQASAETQRLSALVYLGRLQTWVAEHSGLLYQAEVVGSRELGQPLSELEDRLIAGSAWLDTNGMKEAASSLREYLRVSAGGRGGGRSLGPAALAGPVHQAVWQTQQSLHTLTDRVAAPATVSPAGPVETPGGERGLAGLAAVLAAAGLVILLLPPEVRVQKREGPNLVPRLADLAERTAGLAGGGGAVAQVGWRSVTSVEELVLGVGAVAAQEREEAALAAETADSAAILAGKLERLIAGWIPSDPGRMAPDLALVAVATLQERHLLTMSAGGALGETQAIAGRAAEATRLAQSLHDQSDQTLQTLTGLMERAGDIDAVVRAIKAIASQTSMLALNASIEAHRAGIEGQGFRVVAESVRDLSNQADRHAREIELRVQGISEALAAAAHDSWRQRGLSGDLQRELSLVENQAGEAARRVAETREAARVGEEAAAGLCTAIQQMAASASPTAGPPDLGSLLEQARSLMAAAKALAAVSGEQFLALAEVRRISEDARSLCRQAAQAAAGLESGAGRVHVEVERLRHVCHH